MRLVDRDESILVGVRDAGVRNDFYKRERPGGETTYDIEWSLGQAEAAALPVIARLADRWPLDDLEDKGRVGQFFALQHLRGPAFKTWHDGHVRDQIALLKTDPAQYTKPVPNLSAQEAVERVAEALTSRTYRLTRMLHLVRAVGILFSSMRWTLVRFPQRRLVTSDHPVVVWPTVRGRTRPQSNELGAGVSNTLEVLVPISPELLLMMTWLPEPDHESIIDGSGRHLATTNAFVVANAETQWFHEPGVTPWLARGPRDPLSRDLLTGYDAAIAASSSTRRRAEELAQTEIATPLSNDPVSVVSVDS